jgi:hypothetical protein
MIADRLDFFKYQPNKYPQTGRGGGGEYKNLPLKRKAAIILDVWIYTPVLLLRQIKESQS